jgi:hypothetical protein
MAWLCEFDRQKIARNCPSAPSCHHWTRLGRELSLVTDRVKIVRLCLASVLKNSGVESRFLPWHALGQWNILSVDYGSLHPKTG